MKDRNVYRNSATVTCIREIKPKGRYLLFVRCSGDGPELDLSKISELGNIDIILSYYSSPSESLAIPNVGIFTGGLSKYQAFHEIWKQGFISRDYESYAFFDADVKCDALNLFNLFGAGEKIGLSAWHPSLTEQSFTKWFFLYQQISNINSYRKTNFIEVMSPFFSNEALKKCLVTFSDSISTWGLDFSWSRILTGNDIGVIDSYPITHEDKPDLTGGAFYRYLASIGVNPRVELWKMRFKYNMVLFRPGICAGFQEKVCRTWIDKLRETDRQSTSVSFIEQAMSKDQSIVFLNHHSLLTLCENGIMPNINTLVYADGGLLKTQLGLKGKRQSFDFTGVADIVLRESIRANRSILCIGGDKAESKVFRDKMKARYKTNDITTIDGYKSKEEIISLLDMEFKNKNARTVILGLGTPKQEDVLLNINLDTIDSTVISILTCGGFISQTASSDGVKYYPKIIELLNLRAIWRIIKEPHVLKRVLINYPKSICLIFRL